MTAPVYDRHGVQVHHGDCLDVMRTLPDASVDAVVTDPPYGLADLKPGTVVTALTEWIGGNRSYVPSGRGFMGRSWDAFVPPPAVWDECLRVLKPGGHLLCFAGTRTADLMGISIRLAGFEIRDEVSHFYARMVWCYGSGFPKSRAVSRDDRFCQCLPGMPGAATEEAAESAAQVLLAEVHGHRSVNSADLTDLHGLPVDIHSDYAVPGGSEQDLLANVRCGKHVAEQAGEAVSARPAGNGALRAMWEASAAFGDPDQVEPKDVLLSQLPGDGAPSDATGERLRRDRDDQGAPIRGGQPGMEGRGDLPAGEGELHRPAVRPMPSGPAGDGPVGRVRDGASTGDGPLDRTPADTHRVREPHRPQPAEQPPLEPGAVSDERGPQAWRGWPVCGGCGKPRVPAGLGTALKPSQEPVLVARKPLTGTVAATVLEHGTGALNIGACKVAHAGAADLAASQAKNPGRLDAVTSGVYGAGRPQQQVNAAGRWPSNLVLTHAGRCDDAGCRPEWCPVAELDAQSGELHTQSPVTRRSSKVTGGEIFDLPGMSACYDDAKGSGASRFFHTFRWEAKAPASERPMVGGKAHETVKPLGLIRFFVRLVCVPGGTVLDCFAGSGTTGQAARAEGMKAVLIEQDGDHIDKIRARLDARPKTTASAAPAANEPMDLLDLLDDGAAS